MEKWRIICDSSKIKLVVNGIEEEIFFDEKEQKEYKGIRLGEGKLDEYVLISSKYLDEYCKEQEMKVKEYEEAYKEGYKKGMEAGKKTYEQSLEKKEQKEQLKGLKLGAKGRDPISNEKVKLIKKMHLEGHSVRSIAKTVDVGVGTVQKYSK